jgi:hypothetical protein
MKIIGWCTTFGLGLVGVTSFVATGCTSTTTVNGGDDGGVVTADDAGDGATITNDGATVTPDTGTGDDAGDGAAATCGAALDTGSADCDTCVATSCCTALTTCVTPDDAGVDDAGSSACEQLLGCINDYNTTTDAGTDAGAGESACDPSYTADEQTSAEAVFTCIRTSCATQCPGL